METTNNLPACVGFIMDGNRRWARDNDRPTLEGHLEGKEVFSDMVRTIAEFKIPHAVFYAFSTENWLRTSTEVSYLLNLFSDFINVLKKSADNEKNKVRVCFIGNRNNFSLELKSLMSELEEKSAEYTNTTIWIALSYGGRAELVQACNQAIAAGRPVDEATLGDYLFTAGMPDPDLIIRTGGEQRLSNFLPWQSVYSELFFTDTYWPAFTKDEFTRILAQYGDRQRRRGT